jgi:hypothetical protein
MCTATLSRVLDVLEYSWYISHGMGISVIGLVAHAIRFY